MYAHAYAYIYTYMHSYVGKHTDRMHLEHNITIVTCCAVTFEQINLLSIGL